MRGNADEGGRGEPCQGRGNLNTVQGGRETKDTLRVRPQRHKFAETAKEMKSISDRWGTIAMTQR